MKLMSGGRSENHVRCIIILRQQIDVLESVEKESGLFAFQF